jgi:hypothetical protein
MLVSIANLIFKKGERYAVRLYYRLKTINIDGE